MRDDGLGVRALNELKTRSVPKHVDMIEAGTALLDALPDLKDYDKIVFIDAINTNCESVCILKNLSLSELPERGFSLHEMGIKESLNLSMMTEGTLPEVVVMGLAPKRIEMGTELSEEVASEIPKLVEAVLDEIK